MNVLLTGGTGYIGSHTALSLVKAGHQITLFDNLINSEKEVINRLESITREKISFVKGNINDTQFLSTTINKNNIEVVMHFAGLKAVAESFEKPIDYYENNISGTISLLRAMQENRVKKIVFSSSATIYGEPIYLPYDEIHPTSPINPYGFTKLFVENLLEDISRSFLDFSIVALRYFNPVGAHSSGLIGEDPRNKPNNLMPLISKVASGEIPNLSVFGGDYSTPDGTGVRDYIHVMDIAEGHLAALDFLQKKKGFYAFNLGTSKGTSVLELIEAFKKATGKEIPFKICARRPGDIAISYASADKALHELNWKASRSLEEMCFSAWKYKGYR